MNSALNNDTTVSVNGCTSEKKKRKIFADFV